MRTVIASLLLVACSSSQDKTVDRFSDAVASSETRGSVLDADLRDANDRSLGTLHWENGVASIAIGKTVANVPLSDLSPHGANVLLHQTWSLQQQHALNGYITCEKGVFCGTFSLDDQFCSACALVDSNCEVGLQISCVTGSPSPQQQQ